jgi:hypothetical protein
MSRLYLKAFSHTRKTQLTSRGHECLDVEVLWGSKKNPKTVFVAQVTWRKSSKLPVLWLETGKEVIA